MSHNHHARRAAAFPDAPVGTCRHCGERCAPNRRQHRADECEAARRYRDGSDYRAAATAREGTRQRCVDCHLVAGELRRVRLPDGTREWREVVIQRDHPQRLADNGPRHWTSARCVECHEAKTARENSTRRSDRRTHRRRSMSKSKMPTGLPARLVMGGALIAVSVWWVGQDYGAPAPHKSTHHHASTGTRLPSLPSAATLTTVVHWLIAGLVAAAVLAGLYAWARRTADARSYKLTNLGDGIASRTNTDPTELVVKAKRWEGLAPVVGTASYSGHFDDAPGSRGCTVVEQFITLKVRPQGLVFDWDTVANVVSWRPPVDGEQLGAPESEEAGPQDHERLAKIKARVETRVRGEIKGEVVISWGNADAVGPLTFRVAYPSDAPDDSPEWRLGIVEAVNAKAPGRWSAVWRTEEDYVDFIRRPDMPKLIWNPVPTGQHRDQWALPFGRDENGDEVAWDMKLSPHCLVVGGTGSGKTVTIRSIVTEACARGFTVFCADPKRIELTGFRGYPGVRAVASSTEDMIALVLLLADEMDARYAAIEAGQITEDELPPVLLILDEYTEFVNRVNAWWKANKGKGQTGSEHPVVERHRGMARLGRSGRTHLLTGTQRPDARIFGGEARDNYKFRVSLGPLSRQGAEMVYERSDVGRDIPQSAKGRATVALVDEDGVERFAEVQTYYTGNPMSAKGQDREHLDALADAARGVASVAVPYINAETIAAYAEAMTDPDMELPTAQQLAAMSRRRTTASEGKSAEPAAAPAGPEFALVTLDFIAREVNANGKSQVLVDEDGEDVVVTVDVPPCPSVDDEDSVELDYVLPSGERRMQLLDADEKVRRVHVA